MDRRRRQFLVFIAGVGLALTLLAGLLAPSLLSALPGQVRGRLPEEVIRALTTPLPTALPPPISAIAATPVPISALLPAATTAAAASATTEPTAAPTYTPPPTATAVPQETAEPLATITSTATATATTAPTLTPSPTASPTTVPSPTPLPESVLISGLTITPQRFNNCGSANLSVMLNYYGLPDTQDDISAVIKPQYDDRNVSPEELVAYVNERTDLQAAVYRGGDIDTLRTLLQAGFPVIIEKGYEPDEWQGWMGHYLTLVGYDDNEEQFTSFDTYLGPWDSSGRPISYEELEERWFQFNHTFLVIHRAPDAAEVAGLLGPSFTDRTLMWQNAAESAERAAAERPDDAFAWYNMGASLTALAELNEDPAFYTAAAAAFDQSRFIGLPPRMLWYHFDPYKAYIATGRIEESLSLAEAVMSSEGGRSIEESHYYQGLAYLALDEKDLARSAFKRALEMRPIYPEAQARLDQLAQVVDYSNN